MHPLPLAPLTANPSPAFLSVVHWVKLVPPQVPVIVTEKPAPAVPVPSSARQAVNVVLLAFLIAQPWVACQDDRQLVNQESAVVMSNPVPVPVPLPARKTPTWRMTTVPPLTTMPEPGTVPTTTFSSTGPPAPAPAPAVRLMPAV